MATEWLAWFVKQPQVRCEKCRRFNEVNPPVWYSGNCWHWRSGDQSGCEATDAAQVVVTDPGRPA